jgi:hypothetical protein
MKVGDLVTRRLHRHEKLVGIVIGMEACETYFKVCWCNYGTFWAPLKELELINANR